MTTLYSCIDARIVFLVCVFRGKIDMVPVALVLSQLVKFCHGIHFDTVCCATVVITQPTRFVATKKTVARHSRK